ncbi:MAG: hypothetical protein B9S32_10105 [Verrucomicrobia bacterium Tous-C9LFEB]|nr:MAG: hypothetical protein B9S32_10105 [Verrucomicrobia bacterium Tous-C9LFEB]
MIKDTFATGIIAITLICSILTLQSILSIMNGERKSPAMLAVASAEAEHEEKTTQLLRVLAQTDL